MVNFRKNASCPASQELLAFQSNTIAADRSPALISHLSECEFCATEVEFYAHFPQASEECLEAEIPPALYELAEALLNKRKNFSLLNRLLETESIKI